MNKLKISGYHYALLKQHLYPGDNNEAVAIAVCGRTTHKQNLTLTVHEVFLVSYDDCISRRPDMIEWPTEIIMHMVEKAAANNMAVLKIHSHPYGYEKFSKLDNISDKELFSAIDAIIDDQQPHASCIMLPNGRIFGRFVYEGFQFRQIDQVLIADSTIQNWRYDTVNLPSDKMLQLRNIQAFGQRTVDILNNMKIGVVGCSGTGSPVVEQLKRLGVGELVLVDPDYVDKVNMNRIINATLQDAKDKIGKVIVMERSIHEAGFGTRVQTFSSYITDNDVIKELADCDILFGCVDGAEARHVLNQISSFYLIPYFDIGVKFITDSKGGINGIYGSVHFIQPGGSSLLSREVYTIEQLAAESTRRVDKSMYEELERNKYMASVNEPSPAVISINMQVAATAINDFLARVHDYRTFGNAEVRAIRIFFSDLVMFHEAYQTSCPYFTKMVGLGDVKPLLNNPSLSNDKKAA